MYPVNSIKLMPNGIRVSSALPALALGFCAALGLWLTAPLALAQDASAESDEQTEQMTDEVVEAPEQEDEASPAIEEVVVTGSRLKRDTFSSISPLQIITSEASREAGLLSADDILQTSTAAQGQQIDLTFQGIVLDDGPGTSTVNLRGLSSSRTLVLLNGRRIAPSGVEGAPTTPNLAFLPDSLVAQYDLLLDGASSIYGSDAVAGVVNAILRKDFDGFEIQTFSDVPYHGDGQAHTLSLTWGRNFDRGLVGAAFEYSEFEAVEFADRPWTEECSKNVEVDQNGEIRTRELWHATRLGMRWDDCAYLGDTARVRVPEAGSIFYTPGYSNGGWPNFSEAESVFGTFGVDGDGDGETDVSYRDWDINGRENFTHLYPESDQRNAFAYGEYTLEGDMNLTPYFEFLWGNRSFYTSSWVQTLAPEVPADNPFNICNPAAEGGVDCGIAQAALLTNPHYISSFAEYYTDRDGCYGLPVDECTPANLAEFHPRFRYAVPGPFGPQDVQPEVFVRGDRNEIYTETDILRLVGGISGDLPFLNFGHVNDWSFDLGLAYSTSEASSARPGIREDRLNHALGVNSLTNTPCENTVTDDDGMVAELAADVVAGCVPVNMFAPSLYPPDVVIGDFATQAERDYVFDVRDFDTEYTQTLVNFYMTGNLFQLPGGVVAAGLGIEWREDEIKSIPDEVARDGLFFGFFTDGGAEGAKTTQELFAEVEFPFVAGKRLAEEVTLNVSARLTDDEYHGSAWTESFKLGYRPINSLLVRATWGSSYRAPNLRELFLRDQTGFQRRFDPCIVPEIAWDRLQDEYIPSADPRRPYVLENCRREGVDPTSFYDDGFSTYRTEVSAGGSFDLQEETSISRTVGFSWEQPFTNQFELALGTTMYEIKIKNTIIEPSSRFIINDCYYTETGVSPFCSRITRDFDQDLPFFDIIDQGFINRDLERVRGVDVTATFEDVITLFDRPFEVSMDFDAHRLLERSTQELDDEGNLDFSRSEGEWYYPYWTYRWRARLTYDRWRLVWTTDYIDGQKVDEARDDDWDDISGISDTCLGPPDDVLCKDVQWTSDYITHSLSLLYREDRFSIRAGARNLFDQEPPFVNSGRGYDSSSNVPLGAGYMLDGRVFFVEVQVSLGGGL